MTALILWPLVTLQIVMGAFDTLYHHELTERLAWRPSQQHELRLHGVRNLLYAALFLLLGWSETHGALAMLVIAVLLADVVVTLMDFVEGDMSRKLPASERGVTFMRDCDSSVRKGRKKRAVKIGISTAPYSEAK